MTARRASLCLLLATTLFVPDAIAQAKSTKPGELARSAEPSNQQVLRHIVEQHIAAARLTESASAYGISPSLIQLRRYVEPGRKVKMVCVIDLALSDHQGALVATIRGSASTSGASQREAIDAAAHVAVDRLSRVLQTMHPDTPDEGDDLTLLEAKRVAAN